MPSKKLPPLSKTKYLSGLQCHKRLWLQLFQPELAEEADAATQMRFDEGNRVGEVARGLFPGGLLIDWEGYRHGRAMELTRQALSDASVPAIYEAALMHDDIRIRADILHRVGNGVFDLVEVKSATSVKEVYKPDLSIQLYVAQGSGLKIRRCRLMHIDNRYLYPGGEYDLAKLFRLKDITDIVQKLQPEIPERLAEIREALSRETPPKIEVGPHCSSPYACEFWQHCKPEESDFPLSGLYRGQSVRPKLEAEGIDDVREIPEDFPGLTALNRRIVAAVKSGRPYLDPALAKVWSGLSFPLHFIDFETISPGLPRYAGTRPYQQIAFQWSHHKLKAGGTLTHAEFLHEGAGDPRSDFARALIESVGKKGSILIYSSFETTQLKSIALAYPALAPGLEQVMGRFVDLLPIVRKHVYHPDFHGSFSIKAVAPALSPAASYEGMAITDGSSATAAYLHMIDPANTAQQRDEMKDSLLQYCKQDTVAMVEIYRRLVAGE